VLCRIEQKLDRVRRSDKNADRTIDLDILIVDGIPLDEELWTRAHVSVPAAEVSPAVRHPDSGEKLQEAARRLLPAHDFKLLSDLSLGP
jgi:7,8-dihydro-6-hydroxymethylpterin-pyrophosphokinase